VPEWLQARSVGRSPETFRVEAAGLRQ